jgi:hypothetical protein
LDTSMDDVFRLNSDCQPSHWNAIWFCMTL